MAETFTDIEITEILNMAFGQSVQTARIDDEKDGRLCRKIEGMIYLKNTIDYILVTKSAEKKRERETKTKEMINALKGDRQC